MILEYSVNEAQVQPAWLKTLYDLVEELNCKCRTYIDESYNRSFKQFTRTRTIEVYGSDTMLSWLKLRMERYSHFINEFNDKAEIQANMKTKDATPAKTCYSPLSFLFISLSKSSCGVISVYTAS